MSEPKDKDATEMPQVPSLPRFAWLLFMQPLRLHEMTQSWGIEGDASLWKLRKRFKELHVGAYVETHLALSLLGALVTLALCGALSLALPVKWESIEFAIWLGMGFGIVAGILVNLPLGTVSSVSFSMTLAVLFGIAGEVRVGMASGAVIGMAYGVVFPIAIGVTRGTVFPFNLGMGFGMLTGLAFGVGLGTVFGSRVGMGFGMAFGVCCPPVILRVPSFLISAAATTVAAILGLAHTRPHTTARWLPFRHLDLLRWPLPGLHRLLIDIGTQDPVLGRQLVDEAAASLGQARPARRALHELQARDLERLARNRAWSEVAALRGPFFPIAADLADDDPLRVFVQAARDLRAARTGSQRHRKRLLDAANERIESFQTTIAGAKANERQRRLLRTARDWRDVIADRRAALDAEISANQEIEDVYVAGQVFDPTRHEHVELFRRRPDAIAILAACGESIVPRARAKRTV